MHNDNDSDSTKVVDRLSTCGWTLFASTNPAEGLQAALSLPN